MIEIQRFERELRDRWDEFVLAHPHGSPFHLIAWKNVIEQAFGYEPVYLAAVDGGTVRGVLPLFFVKGLFVGKALISTPFAVYGGVLADSPEVRDALAARAGEMGRELQVEHVELRNAFPEQCTGWSPLKRYVTFSRALKPQTDEELLADIPKKTRNMVRKSLKTEFDIRRGCDWKRFERLHSLTLRRLGTPSFPPKLFAALLAEFGKMVDVCEVLHDDELASTSLSFLYREQMHIYYAATHPKYNALAANYRMYFDHLMWAGANGFTLFDFGRSKLNTGTFEFKKHWETEMRELPYEILLVKRKELPNLSPVNPKFDLAIRVWRKIPLPLTRLLGPRLVRLFP